MKIKHDIDIPIDSPFKNCKLGREGYAQTLTQIVENYSDGFVLAINNEWGSGKTTFVKMWQAFLIQKEYSTVYFNAWENDFNDNPLVALMSELKSLTKGKLDQEIVFKSVVTKGAILAKNVAPALVKAIVKKYLFDTDIVIDAVEDSTKAATEILEEEIKDYADKKKSIIEFRNELEKFIEKQKSNSRKPLVFIIDELDRCRPNYAVELLEQLKHFFSVNGIIFVLSIDKSQLSSAVRGFYGSEHINTDEYLRRFIDLEYSIPRPKTSVFSEYLYNYYELDKFFDSEVRRNNSELRNDGENLLQVAKLIFEKADVTLRQQEKIFGRFRIVLSFFKNNERTFSYLIFVLIHINTLKTDLYQKLENNQLSLQELSNAILEIFKPDDKRHYGLNFTYILAQFLVFYNNNQDYDKQMNVLNKADDGQYTSSIKLGGIEKLNQDFILSLVDLEGSFSSRDVKLNSFIRKVSLTDPLVIN